ncbi:DUF2878 family protein [Oceanisphaera sp. KMM 10153]|uniref:DUF2878 family protein n=1 Tax=Oceanisphaera submarina TaxID=3390193 RepID=UPI0039752B92
MSRWQWTQLLAFEGFWLLAVAGQNSWSLLTGFLLLLHFVFTPSRRADVRVLWLALLWAGFVLTLGYSLCWLRRVPLWLLMPIGAVAGTSSYLAGWQLGAVSLPLGFWPSAVILALLWSVLLPLLVRLERRARREA